MYKMRMFDRKGALTTEGFEGSAADPLARCRPLIKDGKKAISVPDKLYSPVANERPSDSAGSGSRM
ncbi:MAG: hypothetical protein O7H41_09405 [Planctomycetota bacterium]|nr:hypothetical protein [Planctomycetota bacterium]